MSAYGYEIVQTLIVDIEPDAQVKRAMNEINAGKFANSSFRFWIGILPWSEHLNLFADIEAFKEN